MRRLSLSTGLVAALALWASGALAADEKADAPGADDPVRAKVLFDQAVELASNGDFKSACEKLERSLALHDGLGTSFHLAGCWQKIGRTASAYALLEKVVTRAHEAGQAEREGLAQARLDALGSKLSRLRIDVASPAPETEVRRDDEVVPASKWGQPVPVDRGPHEIRVTAAGKQPFTTKLDVTEPATTVAVQVPALADEVKEPPTKPAAEPAPEPKPELRKQAPPPAPPAPQSDGGTQRTIAIVVGGVGVVALGAGVLEGAEYLHSNRQAKGLCPSGLDCTTDEINQHAKALDDARTARTWSYVGVGAGGAALVAGAYLFFTAPHGSDRGRAKALRVAPIADGSGTFGGALLGSF